MEKEKKFLASANSGNGFIQYFDDILDKTKSGFTYVLKGGSGTGKSTLMRKVGEHFKAQGLGVEDFYCSSDLSSLDGVRIVEKNVAIVDGTFPHVREANMPMVTDKIINLGDYIDANVKIHEKEISEFISKKKKCFVLAYDFIGVAKKLFEAKEDFLNSEIEIESERIIEKLRIKKTNRIGKVRRLFSKSISVNGEEQVFDETPYKKLFINGTETQISKALESISKKVNELGFNTIEFANVLVPKLTETLFLEEYKIVVKGKKSKEIKENEAFFMKNIKKYEKIAGAFLEEAKTNHKEVEKYYIANLNFEGLNVCTKKIIDEIEKMD